MVYQVFDPNQNLVATGSLLPPVLSITLNLPASEFYNIQILLNSPGTEPDAFQFLGVPFLALDNLALVSGFPLLKHPTCGLPNGSIAVEVAGGSGDYTALAVSQKGTTFNSSPSPFGNNSISTFSDLPEDTYTITINDTNSCSFTAPAIQLANATDAITVTLGTITPPRCSNGKGSVSFTVTGGAAPYSACLAPAANPTGCTPQPVVGARGTLEAAPGSYVLFVTDNGGCSGHSSVVTIPPFSPSGVPLPDYILNKYCCVSSV